MEHNIKAINITKPFLPHKEEFNVFLDRIWEQNWLTNNGPLVNDLEHSLKEKLNLINLLFTTNGTIALQMAIKALDLKGEIITTPFSYVATTSSIVWEGCKPVFVDIDKKTFNIDPSKIELAITKKTSAILATHVFGNPCNIESIESIAKKYNLCVIYDAAHCFGVDYKGKSILTYGDISTISFHATKLFHTVEGGAVCTNSNKLNYRLSKLRNFGHNGDAIFDGIGINGKNSEFHAAMGLANFKHIDSILEKRKKQYLYYKQKLNSPKFRFQKITENTIYNYAYFPIVFKSEQILLKVKKVLENNKIYARRYFYPSLSSLKYVDKYSSPISDDIASRVLCLPIYHSLEIKEQRFICKLIISNN